MTVSVTTIVDAEVDGERVDVRIEGDGIVAAEQSLDRSGSRVVDAGGGALLPGLHDHHIHLLAMAAALTSIDLGKDAAGFDDAIREAHQRAAAGRWLRAVGYDDIHGPLDRQRLDRLAPGRPVRVQHRSGAMWVVTTAALAQLGIDADDGRLHRLDHVLADRLPREAPPDLAPVGTLLARYGITGVTDATPYDRADSFDVLAAARRAGALPQRVTVTGGTALARYSPPAGLDAGPVKVVVADNALPTVEQLAAAFQAARSAGRTVAVHCVTAVGLVLALAAWDEVPSVDGDRIEHGSVIPVDLVGRIRELGLTVVTQPGFIADRGDRYRVDVDPEERADLYRCNSLFEAGIPVAGSTDAPFGPADPWLAIRTAIDRRTASGVPLGVDEAVDPRRAIGLFLGTPDRPGRSERTVVAGAAADLCLLKVPLGMALRDPSAELVRACWIAGRLVTGD